MCSNLEKQRIKEYIIIMIDYNCVPFNSLKKFFF